ncbi:hypothetical protein INR49_019708 [Caranx melampygus]|nr:hypothetical protein INR49_019708 [Caranx melampygus]
MMFISPPPPPPPPDVELPDSFTAELKDLLEGLLQRDVSKRLGCQGRGAPEVKEHQFFKGIDWQQVYLQKLSLWADDVTTLLPPLIPPRGEVNAADAFDIGSFDEEDTKGIKVPHVHMFDSHRDNADVCSPGAGLN